MFELYSYKTLKSRIIYRIHATRRQAGLVSVGSDARNHMMAKKHSRVPRTERARVPAGSFPSGARTVMVTCLNT